MTGRPTAMTEIERAQGPHAGKGYLPGEPALWVFVLGDLAIFSTYLIIYMIHRSRDVALFRHSQDQLNQGLGVVNTLILITSSWFIALGVQATRKGNHARARNLVTLCIGCGLIFCIVKIVEWSSKISHGITIETDPFFSFYFMLTGTHLYHLVIGLGVLIFTWWELRRSTQPRIAIVEGGAIIWHMVDLLWIVIYAFLYLMR